MAAGVDELAPNDSGPELGDELEGSVDAASADGSFAAAGIARHSRSRRRLPRGAEGDDERAGEFSDDGAAEPSSTDAGSLMGTAVARLDSVAAERGSGPRAALAGALMGLLIVLLLAWLAGAL